MVKLKSKNCKYYQKDIHLGQNTLIQCSRITACSYIAFFGGFGLMLKVPVNNFSVMLGRIHRFLGITSTFLLFFSFFWGGWGLLCLAQGHNTATRVGLEPTTSGSGV